MLSRIAEFIYTVLLKPRLLRQLANYVIRLLLPKTVRYGDSVVALNPNDPVVSGALAFRVYETTETNFINTHIHSGCLFIDVGANVGYYTALAMHKVGNAGNIVALEPDPECFNYLQQTVALNGDGERVHCYQLAAGREEAEGRLYISSDNRGDNRLYASENATGSIPIHTNTLDQIISAAPVDSTNRPVFIKMDVQGAEGAVISGAQQLLANTKELTLMMEFWPYGLQQMGTDPQVLMQGLEQNGLSLFELAGNGRQLIPITDKQAFISRYPGRKYTNIVALKQRASTSF